MLALLQELGQAIPCRLRDRGLAAVPPHHRAQVHAELACRLGLILGAPGGLAGARWRCQEGEQGAGAEAFHVPSTSGPLLLSIAQDRNVVRKVCASSIMSLSGDAEPITP